MRENKLTIIAAGSMIRGEVFSQDLLMIEGGVEGNVFGQKVVVKPTGWVHGDVLCRSLSIEPGGVVDGAVKVAEKGTENALAEAIAQPAEGLPAAQTYTLGSGGRDEQDEETEFSEEDQAASLNDPQNESGAHGREHGLEGDEKRD